MKLFLYLVLFAVASFASKNPLCACKEDGSVAKAIQDPTCQKNLVANENSLPCNDVGNDSCVEDIINYIGGLTCESVLESLLKVLVSRETEEQVSNGGAYLAKGCFAHDSVVTTLDGEKTMCALEVGDRVRSSSGWSTVVVMYKQDSKTELLDISFSNGKHLALTPNHYLKVNGTWMISEEAQVGMYTNEDVKVTQIVKYYDHVCDAWTHDGNIFVNGVDATPVTKNTRYLYYITRVLAPIIMPIVPVKYWSAISNAIGSIYYSELGGQSCEYCVWIAYTLVMLSLVNYMMQMWKGKSI